MYINIYPIMFLLSRNIWHGLTFCISVADKIIFCATFKYVFVSFFFCFVSFYTHTHSIYRQNSIVAVMCAASRPSKSSRTSSWTADWRAHSRTDWLANSNNKESKSCCKSVCRMKTTSRMRHRTSRICSRHERAPSRTRTHPIWTWSCATPCAHDSRILLLISSWAWFWRSTPMPCWPAVNWALLYLWTRSSWRFRAWWDWNSCLAPLCHLSHWSWSMSQVCRRSQLLAELLSDTN